MARVLRIFRHAVTILSLLLLVGTLIFWLRGHFRSDYIFLNDPDSVLTINNRPGAVSIWATHLPENESCVSLRSCSAAEDYDYFPAQRCGFAYEPQYPNPPKCGALLGGMRIPHYAIAGLTLLLPLRSTIRFTKAKRRLRLGLCSHCGYDVRFTPTRCPECGHPPSSAHP